MLAPIFALQGEVHSQSRLVAKRRLSEALVAEHYVLKNGLNVVIVVDRTTPTFEYQTFYCVGAADEPEGQQGRIHFLEHLMAETNNRPSGELNRQILLNGGKKNAFTSDHYMYLTMRLPEDKLGFAVEIDADWSFNTLITRETIEREREIILAERDRSLDSPDKILRTHLFSLIYGKPKYSIIGEEEFIREIDVEEILDVYRTYCGLKNKLIVIVGDVDVDEVLKEIVKRFKVEDGSRSGGIPVDHQLKTYPNRKILGKTESISSRKIRFSLLRKSWYAPGMDDSDFAVLYLITYILEVGPNSLRSHLVDTPIVGRLGVGIWDYKGFGILGCSVEFHEDTSFGEVEEITQRTLDALKTSGVSEVRLLSAKNQALKDMYYDFQNRSTVAYLLGKSFVHTGNPIAYFDLVERIESADSEDIKRAASRYLVDENSITVIMEPVKDDWFSIWTIIGCLIIISGFMFFVLGIRKLIKFVFKSLRGENR